MAFYIIKRLAAIVPVLLVVSICSFVLVHSAHGDPAVAMYGSQLEKMRPQDQERIRENLGLNEPLFTQYGKWLNNVLQGELGVSYLEGRPVGQILFERLPNTLILNTGAFVLMLGIAVVVGTQAAVRPYSWFDNISTVLAFILYATPSFWLALLAILVFAVYLGWFPSAGLADVTQENNWGNRLYHLVLPTTVLALSHVGSYLRLVRASMLTALNSEYVTAARAKGLPLTRIYYVHALRNALIPLITYCGMSFSSLIGGAYLVETVFAYPGLGQLAIHAAATRDYPLLMGTVLLTGLFVAVGNFLADILCAWADPRLISNRGRRRRAYV